MIRGDDINFDIAAASGCGVVDACPVAVSWRQRLARITADVLFMRLRAR